jgi:hypothetical protein
MSCQWPPSSTASADSRIMLSVLRCLVLPPAVHHHRHLSRSHYHPPADCCLSLLSSCHCMLCSHLQSMSCHPVHDCPLPPLVLIILLAASTIVFSHSPSPPSLPSPPLSSFPLNHILFDCYVVIRHPSSEVRCLLFVVRCSLFVVHLLFLSFVVCCSLFVVHRSFFVIRHPSSIVCLPLSIVRHPQSVVCCPLSRHLSCVIHRPSSVCHRPWYWQESIPAKMA